jgi:sugar O-acyltransferase (sialic acid O-acetyltransferase NeuD family)
MNYIFGIGGFGREAMECYKDAYKLGAEFMVDDQYHVEKVNGISVRKLSEFDVSKDKMFIAVGDPKKRKEIVNRLPKETQYFNIIHPSAVIGHGVLLGNGIIITAGCIVTCNIELGNHAHLNLCTTIGHDCKIGDYFTTAPGVNISGNCDMGECVYFGTNASIKQGVRIGNNVTIGMGMTVTKSIGYDGVYINKFEIVKL